MLGQCEGQLKRNCEYNYHSEITQIRNKFDQFLTYSVTSKSAHTNSIVHRSKGHSVWRWVDHFCPNNLHYQVILRTLAQQISSAETGREWGEEDWPQLPSFCPYANDYMISHVKDLHSLHQICYVTFTISLQLHKF